MDVDLNVALILRRMRAVHHRSRVISRSASRPDGPSRSATFAEVLDRSERLAAGLAQLGVKPGDRVGSLAWNTQEHLETYYAVTGMGAVLHTANPRLHEDQLVYTVNHARDSVLIVESSFRAQIDGLRHRLPHLQHVVVIEAAGSDLAHGEIGFEDLIAQAPQPLAPVDVDERAAAALCYTSGTTGDPKGVLYSHRSIVLHSLAMAGRDVFRIGEEDVVLGLVPLFHALGWGLPFLCGLTGADMVLPGPNLQPDAVAELISEHRVTWAGGVPTVWMDLLRLLQVRASAGTPVDLSSLKTVVAGGTAVPEALMRAYGDLGVGFVQGWGMTEVFPGATMVTPSAMADTDGGWQLRTSAGRVSPLYEMRVVTADGTELPRDGVTVGELEIRGPMVAGSYLDLPVSENSFRDGWLRTGDVGTIDANGWMRITDRLKDAIKSGGEWISSVDLESALMAHPSVHEAAVVGRPDARWGERPAAFVVTDRAVDTDELRDHLTGRVAKWWIPDDFRRLEHIPRTSTGKFDKKALRESLEIRA
ncbi:fatty-acyl-CoA synthase [Geodermatophilus sabuli]|uniref:Fatty-acyl-CoA synthase n=2 Tax=Geodermatophilus sabuli TaxID=1564158 RepID=A0A285E672_9ACTN|nr:fatty-acyl-CoA synthase [Geodermatophilus sabuli]SNX94609.1 fatty-acyl-CoA synthase [Geodermatophilus sabuli]